jgi:hypothetical protein
MKPGRRTEETIEIQDPRRRTSVPGLALGTIESMLKSRHMFAFL